MDLVCIQPGCSIGEIYRDKSLENIFFSSLLFVFVQAFRETI